MVHCNSPTEHRAPPRGLGDLASTSFLRTLMGRRVPHRDGEHPRNSWHIWGWRFYSSPLFLPGFPFFLFSYWSLPSSSPPSPIPDSPAQCFNNRKQSATVFHHRLTLVPARCHRVSVVPVSRPASQSASQSAGWPALRSLQLRRDRGIKSMCQMTRFLIVLRWGAPGGSDAFTCSCNIRGRTWMNGGVCRPLQSHLKLLFMFFFITRQN